MVGGPREGDLFVWVLPAGPSERLLLSRDGTAWHTATPLFKYLTPSESADEKLVSPEGIEPSANRSRERVRPSVASRSER
jgi:hypothetical protein